MKNLLSWLGVLVLAFFLTGCSQTQQETATELPSIEPTVTADCIASYFKTDASSYITQQEHQFNPLQGLFLAASTEPVGTVSCSLLKDDFKASGKKWKTLSDFPESFWNKNLASAVFYGFSAGSGLLDTGTMSAAENIKIEGQWYKSLIPQWPGNPKLILLQSLEDQQIELILLDDASDGHTWLIHSYNRRYNKDLSVRLPQTIDIYDIRDGVASKEIMIRFDYKQIAKISSEKVSDQ